VNSRGRHPQADGRPHRDGGQDITQLAPHKFCEAGIALVPEGRRLFTGMTVAENLDIGSFLPAAKARRRETLDEVLALFPALKAKLLAPPANCRAGSSRWWRSRAH
jgi:branched-chain amino acid transport system ATP-binding protein